jgi:UDP-N-acetylmuramoyl-tripeptide--D-alanyl-D-alanine ligase
MSLWTLEEIQKIIQGQIPGDIAVTGISIDTRTLQPGDLFVALVGTTDGTQYVDDAIAKGAVAAIASKQYNGKHIDKVLIVDDTLAALHALAAAARARCNGKIIALTGSVGKTSTKEILAHVLSVSGKTHATVGNLNNHFGLPLTLARMPRDTKFAVLEMGMNHAHEITPLTALAKPDITIITNVDAVHLENFTNIEGIADAKAEILSGLDPDNGLAVLNRDNHYYLRLLGHAHDLQIKNIQSFGSSNECDAQVLSAKLSANQTTVSARIHGQYIDYVISTPGAHWVPASLAVLLAATAVGADLKISAAQMCSVKPAQGRGWIETIAVPDIGMITVIDESYNASPVSVAASLATLGQLTGRKIVALGDMLELGEHSATMHRNLASHIVESNVDLLFCAGTMMRELFYNTPPSLRGEWAADSTLLVGALLEQLENGDLLLVKGSRGMKMEVILSALRRNNPKAAHAV